MHSPLTLRHARLLNFVDLLLRTYIRRKKLGELHREAVAVRLSSRNVFMPDFSFFTNEEVARRAETHAPFAPSFVVEVLSKTTSARDLGPKFAAYEEHGVEEYWIFDPIARQHRFHRREEEFFVEITPRKGRIDSKVIPGFWLKPAWLDPENLPDEDEFLAEILA